MARKKKSMIGFDPLAWLDGDTGSDDETPPNTKEVKGSSYAKGEMIEVLGKSIDANALVKSYGLIQDSLSEIVTEFYEELFSQHPDVVPLFNNTDEAGRASKLSAALILLFNNINDEDALINMLSDLGNRHQAYGAEAEHYGVVAGILIDTCHKHVGRSWTKKMNVAWESLFVGVAETMLAAYHDNYLSEIEPVVVVDDNHIIESIIEDAPVDQAGDVLMLENIQDISKSEELKENMLNMVKSSKQINIDASMVARIDGSALQLLCGLFQYAKTNDIKLSWVDPSDALLSSIEFMNLGEELELDYFGLF